LLSTPGQVSAIAATVENTLRAVD